MSVVQREIKNVNKRSKYVLYSAVFRAHLTIGVTQVLTQKALKYLMNI